MHAPTSPPTFENLYTHLTTQFSYPLLPNPSPNPHTPQLTHTISSLNLHPTLESLLHILNADLPSAHFLCRHMQNEPAWEGMYVHGLLHRVEGDYENAKAWYTSVDKSDVFERVWGEKGGLEGAKEFADELKKLKAQKQKDAELEKALREQSRREFDLLTQWCREKFGTREYGDASVAWTEPSEEHRAVAAKMIVGGEGWRQF